MNITTNNSDNTWPSADFFSAATHPVFKHALETLLIVIDRSGYIVFINDAFQSASGFRESELLGKHFCLLFPEHQREAVQASFAEQMNAGEFASDFVIPLHGGTGEVFYIHWTTSVLTDSHGNFEYLVGSGVDTTEHRNTLIGFKKSRKRFQNLVETTRDWVWETDATQHFTYSSPQVEVILGYRPEEMIGKTPFDFMREGEAGKLKEQFAQMVKTDHTDRALYTKFHKDGHNVTLETSGVSFFSNDDELLGFRGISRDITDRQNALQALKKSEERLRLSQQFANIGNWEWDIATGDIYWSKQVWALFGQEMHAFKPSYQTFIECIHPDDREMVVRAVDDTLHHGTTYEAEYRLIWPNGKVRWLRATGNVVLDLQGKPARMLGLVMNIDLRKHHEQEQMRQAEKQRNTLIREVHHRIKNNLQGIIGLLRNNLSNTTNDPGMAIEKAITQIHSIALIHGIHGQRAGGELLLCEMLPAIVENHTPPGQGDTEIDLSVDIDTPLQVQDNEAVPVALILNELLTNALKHANNTRDKVCVSLLVVNGRGVVRIHCPGGCLPEGFDFQRGAGLGTGLELVRALLPPAGMSIQYQQDLSGVSTEVMLQAPVVRRGVSKLDC